MCEEVKHLRAKWKYGKTIYVIFKKPKVHFLIFLSGFALLQFSNKTCFSWFPRSYNFSIKLVSFNFHALAIFQQNLFLLIFTFLLQIIMSPYTRGRHIFAHFFFHCFVKIKTNHQDSFSIQIIMLCWKVRETHLKKLYYIHIWACYNKRENFWKKEKTSNLNRIENKS